ncbi:MAG: SUMF1/EgtB/PvdO family nonheme iron enzyme [Anaerolineales bacterium]|nr:SUMF1/EgtB/PvdO family nonheme iron enzyme [Anaerolineales bacterium]
MKRAFLLLFLIPILAIGCTAESEISTTPPASIDTGVDPDTWVLVPAGEFLMGLHEHETMVDYDYEIMVTSVTNEQYAQYLNEALASGDVKIVDDEIVGYYPGDKFHDGRHEERIEEGDWLHVPRSEAGLRIMDVDGRFSALAGYENHPMVHVTWFGAKAYCEYYGGRLPTEIEWEKAARGTDNRPFPWGDEIRSENANFYSSHDLFEKIVGRLGDTTPVGFYNGKTYDDFETADSPSPYGLYDMAGNVWDWTGDVYEEVHYRYMRGGSKADYAYNLRVWTRNNATPEYYSPSVGFRCVRDPVN